MVISLQKTTRHLHIDHHIDQAQSRTIHTQALKPRLFNTNIRRHFRHIKPVVFKESPRVAAQPRHILVTPEVSEVSAQPAGHRHCRLVIPEVSEVSAQPTAGHLHRRMVTPEASEVSAQPTAGHLHRRMVTVEATTRHHLKIY